MRRRDRIIFEKIISETDICTQMIAMVPLDDFLADEKLKRACAMTVINIGELVKNITDETRIKYNHIPWKAIAGMRDIAAHAYQTLRMEDVYNTIITDLPELKRNLANILENEN